MKKLSVEEGIFDEFGFDEEREERLKASYLEDIKNSLSLVEEFKKKIDTYQAELSLILDEESSDPLGGWINNKIGEE